MIFFVQYRYGGRYTVSMLPGDGIGPEMMGYVKDIFREVGAPVDFETVELDPTTDNYDDNNDVQVNFLPTPGIERFFLMVYALAFGLVSSVYL